MELQNRPAGFNAFAVGCLGAFVFPAARFLFFLWGLLLVLPLLGLILSRLHYSCRLRRGRIFLCSLVHFKPALFLFFLLFLGLCGGLLCQVLWVSSGGAGIQPYPLQPGMVVEGVADRDLQIRYGRSGPLFSLQLRDCRLVDLQGRELAVTDSSPMRFMIPSDSPQLPDGSASLVQALIFTGQRVRLVVDMQGRTVRIQDLGPPEGALELRGRILGAFIKSCIELKGGAGNLVVALLLGRQDFLPPADQQLFGKTGCIHLIALSGMHISLVLSLAFGVFRRLIGYRMGTVAGLLAVVVLVWLVGPFPSAVRALIMCLWSQSARLFGYRLQNREALGLGTLSLMLFDPSLLFSLGYQLSCITLYGMFFLQDWLCRGLTPLVRPVIAQGLCPGIAAQGAALPVLLVRELPWYPQGLLAGLVLEPLCLVLMGLGLLWAILGMVCVPGAVFLLDFFMQGMLGPCICFVFGCITATGRFFIWFP